MNNEQNHKMMKVQAQDLKVSMKVKIGWMTVTITEIENHPFKNGKPAVKVFGVLDAYIVGKGKYRRTIPAGDKTKKVFHASTMVPLA